MVVELGAAGGGWTGVLLDRIGTSGTLVSVDIDAFAAPPGALPVVGDVTHPRTVAAVRAALGGGLADVVVADMAPPFTGDRNGDRARVCDLASEVVGGVADAVLREGGSVATKAHRCAEEQDVFLECKAAFAKAVRYKPAASRQDSAEIYIVGTGFRRGNE